MSSGPSPQVNDSSATLFGYTLGPDPVKVGPPPGGVEVPDGGGPLLEAFGHLENFMAERIWELETVVAKKIGVACDSPARSIKVTVAVVITSDRIERHHTRRPSFAVMNEPIWVCGLGEIRFLR